ncbi:MAG TPA: choice-of-anchor J domain-containing protein, partial [Adhaeribacter sp.]|nr:choice-of-anchor J domain-containing protein [Adhaeribacter sp.]
MQKPLRRTTASGWPDLARRLKKLTGTAALAGGILMAGWLTPETVKAQSIASNYTFAASSGTYTPLGASATQLPLVKADTYISPVIPIGFTFNFDDVDYTGFRVSSNGFISFNPSSGAETTNNLSTVAASARPLVAPLWDDLDGRATGDVSNASYEVTGTAGSQVFTFEWRNWEWLYNSNDPVISFQVKLYEGSNKIEFIYQQESGAVVSGSASIGIAGVGSGNFLSLDNTTASPTASSTTSTNNINTKPATGQIYTFNRNPLPAIDVATTGLVSPGPAGCFGTNQMVQVAIKNSGSAPLDFATTPVTVNAAVTGTNATTFPAVIVNTGTLAPGASQNVTIASNFDMSTAGTYTFNASATATGDARTFNDAMAPAAVTVTSKQVAGPVALPQTVDFTGFTGSNLTTVFPNWNEANGLVPTGTTSNWTNDDFANVTTHANGVSGKINIYSTNRRDWLVGPKVLATATTELKYDLALTDFADTAPSAFGSDDELKVMVSTDCGATYTAVRTYNAATTISNTGQAESVNLGSYAGQNIIVAFFANSGTVSDSEDIDVFVDNIFLGTPPTIDMGATALVSPVSGVCHGTSENVIVTIQNFGPNAMDFSTNPVTVNVNVTGAVTQNLSTTLNTGTLASGATQDVTVGTLNMSTAGTYTFNGNTTTTGDGNPGNNDLPAVSINSATIATFPHIENFDSFTAATNATGFGNGWTTTPSGTTSLFRWNVDEGTTPSASTGPTNDHTTGTATGKFIFTEASSGGTGAVAELISPCINLAGQTGMGMEFWYHMYGSTMGTLNVDVFDGTNWVNGFWTISGQQQTTTTSPWAKATINLAAYSGNVIKVRFRALRGTDFYGDMAIDDVRFFNLPALDLGATVLAGPPSGGCYGNAEPVIVTISNFGAAPINFTTTPATVTVNVSGAATQALTATVNTGTLAAGASQDVTVGNLNMTAAGTYTFNGLSAVTGDGDATNDTMRTATRTVTPLATLPQNVNFTGFTGTNLATVAPGWSEAAGTTPAGTTSLWVSSTGLGGAGNVTTKINLYTNTRNEWLMGPKVSPTATSALRFKVAITDYNNLNPDPTGMTGTDDKVQVMVSTDCGLTFTPIHTIDASSNLTNTLTERSVSLAPYAGQQIILAFYATDGPVDDAPDYDLHLDDIVIRNIIAADAGAVMLATASSGCGLTN